MSTLFAEDDICVLESTEDSIGKGTGQQDSCLEIGGGELVLARRRGELAR